MLLTIFLAIVLCGAVNVLMLAAIAYVQDERLFSSAPDGIQEVLLPRDKEPFRGARAIGWTLMVFSIVTILGVGAVAIWDGLRSGFAFWQFFVRFVLIFTIYKLYDMVCFDYFLLLRSRFFQHYYPEVGDELIPKRYGFNIKSQLLKLLVIFPAASALAAWICTLA